MSESLRDRLSIVTLNQCEIVLVSGGISGLITLLSPAVSIACGIFDSVFRQRDEAEVVRIRQDAVLGTVLFAGATKFAAALYEGMDLDDAKISDYIVAAAIGAWLYHRVKKVLEGRI